MKTKQYSEIYPGLELKYNIEEIQKLEKELPNSNDKESILKKIDELMEIDVIKRMAFGEKF